jgi:pimeloyl-ACP methyl ester carboxylesterase
MTTTIRASDGRSISVELSGHPAGSAVFLLHGMPGSRVGPRPRAIRLYQLGVRLIAFDRPGYGDSDRLLGRTVADIASDVIAIADALDIPRFAVLGRSAGGPHALACAALLPDRVTRAAVLVGLAPPAAAGLEWHAGMAASNVAAFTIAANSLEMLAAKLEPQAAAIRANPAVLLAALDAEMADADRLIVSDVGIKILLMAAYAEALRASPSGWIDDVLALRSDWGFDLASVAVPVLLWHGDRDVFSPLSHLQWLADRIPFAEVIVQAGAAHFSALNVVPSVLKWLVTGRLPVG